MVLLLLLLAGGGVLLWRRRQGAGLSGGQRGGSRQAQAEELDTVASWEPSATRLLAGPEREAYQTLRRALPEHMILAQVPLARFIKVPTRNSYAEWMRRVGGLCADIVVCDATSQVIAVVEVRNPIGRDKERAQRRQARMDRVLEAAGIPVHVWLEGALPGPAVARETVLGGPMVFMTKSGATLVDTAVRAKVPPPGSGASMEGLAVQEGVDVDVDLGADTEGPRPVSTWFESEHSGAAPLGPR
ncbi:MAG TPA: DUF2726 domain-containing protein [Candidatus Aquabacterium excrementipullorum]|nr:DUF2726 domain-containing protein [Candidatus Aquabacterium excrementipullorum]